MKSQSLKHGGIHGSRFEHIRTTATDFFLAEFAITESKKLQKIFYFSHCMTTSLKFEITVYFSGFLCQFYSGSLRRIDYPKQLSGPPSFF